MTSKMINQLIDDASLINKNMDEVMRRLEDAREEQIRLSSYADNANEAMMELHRDKTLHYGQQEAELIGAPDPRTGRKNQEWSGMLMDQFLEQDPEYVNAVAELYKAKEALAEQNMIVQNLADQLHNLRQQARVTAAILGVFHGEG